MAEIFARLLQQSMLRKDLTQKVATVVRIQ